ncbi:expressed unknown protein [Seminavis robusta]|uniref:Uncharacterized protein n=1 Tax=Seminavis robusta TaxID=568900 RepID=A0A9N8DU87_9STRA|nr:expressed unknown protein [Seminavis robusta]|eukprot:Sro355_g124960.1 n/a (245) ;mRNA; f:9294-10109
MMLSSQEVLELPNGTPNVLYLNIVVHDATDAVEAKVKQKLKRSSLLPRQLSKAVANRAARAASGIASNPVIASMLGEKLPQKIITKMEEKGITVACFEVFREGPYVVFQIQVLKVDAVVLTNSKHSSTGVVLMGTIIKHGFGLIGTNNQQWVEEGFLPQVVQKKLETIIPELLAGKLEEKNLVADTVVLGEAKQSRYFFAKYREIQMQKPVGFSSRMRSSSGNSSSLFKRSNSSASVDAFSEAA